METDNGHGAQRIPEVPVEVWKIEKLVKELNYHGYLYYVLDSPVITDREYDELYRRLWSWRSAGIRAA